MLRCGFCSQVTRTDANVLLSLDPEDLTVTNKLSYTSVLPEAKVNHKHSPFPVSPAHAPWAPCIPLQAVGLYDHCHQHKARDTITKPDCCSGQIYGQECCPQQKLVSRHDQLFSYWSFDICRQSYCIMLLCTFTLNPKP